MLRLVRSPETDRIGNSNRFSLLFFEFSLIINFHR